METAATDLMASALVQMAEMSRDGMALLDPEHRFLYANPAACALLGSSHEALVGHDFPHHFPLTERTAIEEGLGSNEPARWSSVHVIEGTERAVEYEARPHLTVRGTLWVLALRDMTEQRGEWIWREEQHCKEDQLREREEQYRSVFEAASDGLVIHDAEGKIIEINPAYCRMLGYTRDELINKHVSILIPPEHHHLIAEGMESIGTGETPRARVDVLHKDGTPLQVEGHGVAFLLNGERHYLGVSRDITEQVLAEEQLREREAEYRGIFEATNDGLIIADMDGYIVEANPAFCRMYGYSYDEIIGLHPTKLVHPGYHEALREHTETVKAGGSYRARSMDFRKDGTPIHVEAHGTTFTYKGKPRRLAVLRDITEQVRAYELLEQRVAERTRELTTLLNVSTNVSSTLELRPLLDLILDQLKAVVNFDGATVMAVEGEDLVNLHRQGPGRSGHVVQRHFSMASHELLWSELQRGEPVIIDDVRGNSPLAEDYRRINGELIDTTLSYVRCWMGVPMVLKERVIGVLSLASARPNAYALHDASLVRAFANQAAIAIENARLYERSEQRTRELATLLDVSRDVTSTLELQPLLGLILDQLKLVAPYSGAAVFELRGDDVVALVRRAPGPDPNSGPSRYSLAATGRLWELVREGEPLIIDDVRGDTELARAYGSTVGRHLETTFAYERSFLAAPMVTRERVIGVLTLSSNEPGYFTAHHAQLARAIAQQAAIAMENARLYEQAQEVAALEERQRLARELHDSVSQALFGIGLGARTARALLERDIDKAAQSIDYVLSLTQGGMAEMRALIFELRPESLETEGLVQALKKQAAAVSARHEVPISPTLGDEPDVPLPVKEALYRIAQEALHNAVKHAGPRSVEVSLEHREGELVLEVRDDGAGFDTGGSFPGHLGLHSMRERAQRVGGTLEVESQIGEGTRVCVRVPARSE